MFKLIGVTFFPLKLKRVYLCVRHDYSFFFLFFSKDCFYSFYAWRLIFLLFFFFFHIFNWFLLENVNNWNFVDSQRLKLYIHYDKVTLVHRSIGRCNTTGHTTNLQIGDTPKASTQVSSVKNTLKASETVAHKNDSDLSQTSHR